MRRVLFGLTVMTCLLTCVAAAETTRSGEGGGIIYKGGDNDDNLIKDINDTLRGIRIPAGSFQSPADLRKKIESMPLVNPTSASRAKLCEICGQPLYKHMDEGFICTPPDKNILEVKNVAVSCPVCGARFLGSIPGNVNSAAGVDRDFCVHSVGKYAVYSHVWMCPDCGYAAPIDNLRTTSAHDVQALLARFRCGPDGKPIDEKIKAFVHDKFAATTRQWMLEISGFTPKPEDKFSEIVVQTEIPDWMKYENTLAVLANYQTPHALDAAMYLQAAHACRREVYSEIGVPCLHPELQASLGKSIVRVNKFILSQSLDLRRARGLQIVNPLDEIDPVILADAAAIVIRAAEQPPAQPSATNARPAQFTTGDLYILYLRYAGILDRLGRTADAVKALEKANNCVPSSATEAQAGTPTAQYVERQLDLLRGVVANRSNCLKKERDYLFKAARANLAAIAAKEVVFATYNPLPSTQPPAGLDPVPTTYLLGEFLRRADEPAAAAACFDTASQILLRYLTQLDDAQQQHPELEKELTEERNRWYDQKTWNEQQRAMVKTTAACDDYVKGVLAQIRKAAGVSTGAAGEQTDTAKATIAAPTTSIPTAKIAESGTPANTSGIKTRKELFEMYYAALGRYRKDHQQQNPATLQELVNTGYVHKEQSNLNAAGKLVCPETGKPIVYFSHWPEGEAVPVLMSTAPGLSALYSDGSIHASIVEPRK